MMYISTSQLTQTSKVLNMVYVFMIGANKM